MIDISLWWLIGALQVVLALSGMLWWQRSILKGERTRLAQLLDTVTSATLAYQKWTSEQSDAGPTPVIKAWLAQQQTQTLEYLERWKPTQAPSEFTPLELPQAIRLQVLGELVVRLVDPQTSATSLTEFCKQLQAQASQNSSIAQAWIETQPQFATQLQQLQAEHDSGYIQSSQINLAYATLNALITALNAADEISIPELAMVDETIEMEPVNKNDALENSFENSVLVNAPDADPASTKNTPEPALKVVEDDLDFPSTSTDAISDFEDDEEEVNAALTDPMPSQDNIDDIFDDLLNTMSDIAPDDIETDDSKSM